jgi:hypothetical protein
MLVSEELVCPPPPFPTHTHLPTRRPIYAGNALATVKYAAPGLRMVTVRASAKPDASAQPDDFNCERGERCVLLKSASVA